MRNATRELYRQYTDRVAELNRIGNVAKKFDVVPTVSQKPETKSQESSDFVA